MQPTITDLAPTTTSVAIIARAGRLGLDAHLTTTGGNCEALVIAPAGGATWPYVLVTDGDHGQPDSTVLAVLYTRADDEGTTLAVGRLEPDALPAIVAAIRDGLTDAAGRAGPCAYCERPARHYRFGYGSAPDTAVCCQHARSSATCARYGCP